MHRVKALQNKQRSGNAAPPTTPYTPSPGTFSVFGNYRTVPSLEVPQFTPLGRRAPPPARAVKRPVLPPPVLENAPFGDLLPVETEKEPRKKIPMSLLAPRYSHLLEEAIAVSQMTTEADDKSPAVVEVDPDKDEDEEAEVANATMIVESDVPSSSSSVPAPAPAPVPKSIGNCVKGFLTSYLPTLSKTAPAGPKKAGHQVPRQPGLPLPPLDMLEKRRGPVETPVRVPLPKPKHPKEMVHLHPAPEKKTTMIPRAKKPQRLVELQHVPPPEEEKVVVVSRPRRSSGASVKDLVKNFEEKEMKEGEKRGELRRVKSIGEWRGKVTGVGADAGTRQSKPTWRP